MDSIKMILEGWRNDIIPPKKLKPIIKRVSEERLHICLSCEFNSREAKKLHNYSSLRIDFHCTKCGCPLQKKTKCLSCQCPLDTPKWGALLSTEEETKLNIQNETN